MNLLMFMPIPSGASTILTTNAITMPTTGYKNFSVLDKNGKLFEC
jgi:hypothetical protein